MHDPLSKLKVRDTTNRSNEVLFEAAALLVETLLLPPFFKALLHVILASDSSTSGHWKATDEDNDCCWLSPAELAAVAAMRIWSVALPAADAATWLSLPDTSGTWHVIVLTMVWMWWFLSMMLACSCNVSLIHLRSQVPSQVFWQVHSQALPWRDNPPWNKKQRFLSPNCFPSRRWKQN